jgi:hypothetical protein
MKPILHNFDRVWIKHETNEVYYHWNGHEIVTTNTPVVSYDLNQAMFKSRAEMICDELDKRGIRTVFVRLSKY